MNKSNNREKWSLYIRDPSVTVTKQNKSNDEEVMNVVTDCVSFPNVSKTTYLFSEVLKLYRDRIY